MTTSKKLVENFLVVRIDSECFKTYFEPKTLKSNIFSRVNFFPGVQWFLAKLAKIVRNDKVKKFWSNFFCRNRFRMFQNIFQIKILEIENFFPLQFFSGTKPFLAKMLRIVKNYIVKKFWKDIFLVEVD